jgi:hypothetical protein
VPPPPPLTHTRCTSLCTVHRLARTRTSSLLPQSLPPFPRRPPPPARSCFEVPSLPSPPPDCLFPRDVVPSNSQEQLHLLGLRGMDYTVLCDAISNLREGRVDPLSFLDDDGVEALAPVRALWCAHGHVARA